MADLAFHRGSTTTNHERAEPVRSAVSCKLEEYTYMADLFKKNMGHGELESENHIRKKNEVNLDIRRCLSYNYVSGEGLETIA